MNCPNCHHPIELGWQKLRRVRRANGRCVECGHDSKGRYRCLSCTRKAADRRKKKGITPQ